MRTLLAMEGASMRRAGWLAAGLLCTVACGGSGSDPGQAQGGGTITTPDGGTDAGAPPPSDCAGLLPGTPGAAITFEVGIAGATCGAATVDGEGVSACAAQSKSSLDWVEFGANGVRSGTFSGPTRLLPQPIGFIGLYGVSPLMVARWDPGGTVDPSADVSGDAIALGPAADAGVIAVAASSGSITVHKLDGRANGIASASFTSAAAPLAAAEDSTGVVLAIVGSGSAVSGVWVDMGKSSAGQPFALGTASTATVRALLGGGFMVRLD